MDLASARQKNELQGGAKSSMHLSQPLRRYWPEMLLFLVVTLPWLSLVVLGSVWLRQGDLVWLWSIAVALLDFWLGHSQRLCVSAQRTKLVVHLLISPNLPPVGTPPNAMLGLRSYKLRTPPYR
jgi:hypothetical protein